MSDHDQAMLELASAMGSMTVAERVELLTHACGQVLLKTLELADNVLPAEHAAKLRRAVEEGA